MASVKTATSTVYALVSEHPSNPVRETGYTSASKKDWVRNHPPVTKFSLHTFPSGEGTQAILDGPLEPLCLDDELRLSTPAYPPNARAWRMHIESDAANWFHHEISNVVLPAFGQYPAVLQVAEASALGDSRIHEIVDVMYTVGSGGKRQPVVVVEMKRCLIDSQFWTGKRGNVESQAKLSRELRGYAYKYGCPQIICFDGAWLLMLQFRAHNKESINHAKCEVDCWILPRDNTNGCPLRLAFYRFLVQGFRRCQGLRALKDVSLDQIRPSFTYFSGKPVWKVKGKKNDEITPDGWARHIDLRSGAFYYEKDGRLDSTVWENDIFWRRDDNDDDDEIEDLYD